MRKRDLNRKKRIYLHIFDDYFEFGNIVYYKDEIESYYRTHTDKDCAKQFGVCLSSFKKIVSAWGLKKTNEEIHALTEATLLERYGDPHYNNQEKAKQTMIDKYGSLANAYRCNYEHGRTTKLERYGDSNYNNTEKNKQTCLEKYGVENVFMTEEVKEKIHQVVLDKYGVEWTSQSNSTIEHAKQTFMERYGAESYLESEQYKQYRINNADDIKRKRKEAYDRIIKDNPNYYIDLAAKVCESKKKNHTFNTSSVEEIYYNKLCERYGKDNIERQYKDERYPYHCDFYIKSSDTFVEINNFWTHGKHPFCEEDELDLIQLNSWREKQALRSNGKPNSYCVAEYVWTQLDPEKIKTAVKNNLNYIMVYAEGVYNKYKERIDINDI